MEQYFLHTDRLYLRRFVEGDLDNVYAMVSDPEVMKHYPRPLDMDGARRWLESVLRSYDRVGYSFFAAERKADRTFVGQIGLLHWQDVDAREDVEVAYMLRRDRWGAGYASEAARACRDWAFANLNVDRVVSFIAVKNEPSIAVAERNGMRSLKRLDENRFNTPILIYGITRETWRTL